MLLTKSKKYPCKYRYEYLFKNGIRCFCKVGSKSVAIIGINSVDDLAPSLTIEETHKKRIDKQIMDFQLKGKFEQTEIRRSRHNVIKLPEPYLKNLSFEVYEIKK